MVHTNKGIYQDRVNSRCFLRMLTIDVCWFIGGSHRVRNANKYMQSVEETENLVFFFVAVAAVP